MPDPAAKDPHTLVFDRAGDLWFTVQFGTNKIGTLDPATMKLQEYTLPSPAARSRRIAITGDDAVWFVDYARGRLGRLDPATRQVSEQLLPDGEGSLPYAMAVDDRDRLWVVETGPQPNVLVGFDPQERRFFARAALPSGGGTVRHMVFDRRTREVWFGTDHETLGRARVP